MTAPSNSSRTAAALVALSIATVGCGDAPVVLQIDGSWHIQESFEDEIHLVSCMGNGQVTITQDIDNDPMTGVEGPSTSFSAIAGVDTDCMSVDGPFNYFGNGTFTSGMILPGRVDRVQWGGTVNAAVCQYEGAVNGDGQYGLDMSGMVSCVLEDSGVTFNFVGSWEAHSERSDWCAEQRETLGCSS